MKDSTPTDSQLPSFRRKTAHRRVTTYSDDEDTRFNGRAEDDRRAQQPPHKRSRRNDNEDDDHVDVEAEDPYMTAEEDNRFLPVSTTLSADEDHHPPRSSLSRNPSSSRSTPKSRPSTGKVDVSSGDKPKKPLKKPKKMTVISDEDEDYDEAGDTNSREADAMLPQNEDDFVPSPSSEQRSKGSGTRGKFGKFGGTSKGKGKVTREEKQILFKDERKLPVKEGMPATTGSKRSRLDIDDIDDSVSDKVGSTSPDTATSIVPADTTTANEKDKEPVPKKRKLPLIRKVKHAGSTGSTPGPSTKHSQGPTEGSKEKEKDKNPTGGHSLPSVSVGLPRKPAATVGNADLDLTNKDVYKQLFSHGNAPPRSGIKEKEERVQQLNKMRDEARAKRAEEARSRFDLQEQHDKITYFTKRLESRKSPAVWPNTLAAKFKAEYDERARLEGRARRYQDYHPRHRQSGQQNGWTT